MSCSFFSPSLGDDEEDDDLDTNGDLKKSDMISQIFWRLTVVVVVESVANLAGDENI